MKKFGIIVVLALFGMNCRAEVTSEIEDIKGNPFRSVSFVGGVKPRANALQIDGSKLYLGAGNTLYVYDISKPALPVLLGSVDVEGLCRQIAVKDNVAFVACRETGVWFVDVSRPEAPSVITRYDAVELATGIDVYGDVMFIAERINGVEFVDISDISSPQHIAIVKTPESQSVWYQDGVLYSGEWGRHELTAISASDMSKIKVLSKTPLWGNGDGVFAQGPYLYAATGHHSVDPGLSREENFGNGHSLQIFDISNPGEPRLLSTTRFGKMYSRGNDYWTARPNGDGKMAIVADTFNGLQAVDSRNPSKAALMGHIEFKDGAGKKLSVSSVAIGKGVVYASVFNGGLAVIECPKAVPSKIDKGAEPVNADYRRKYKTAPDSRFECWKPDGVNPVRSVAAFGSHLYAACSGGGLAILSVDGQGRVRKVGAGPQSFVEDVKVRGGKLYAAEGRDGLAVYDILDDGGIREAERIRDIGNGSPFCLWVEVPNDDCIIASPRGAYYWIGAKDAGGKRPTQKLSSSPGWDRYVPNLVFRDNMYAHARAHIGLVWIDLSEGRPKVSGPCKSIVVNQRSGISNYKDGRALVLIKDNLYFLEPGATELPEDGVPVGLNGAPMWDGGNRLAVTERVGRKITLLDVTDDSRPVRLFSESTSGQPEMPVFHQGRLIVPCGYQGLLIQK